MISSFSLLYTQSCVRCAPLSSATHILYYYKCIYYICSAEGTENYTIYIYVLTHTVWLCGVAFWAWEAAAAGPFHNSRIGRSSKWKFFWKIEIRVVAVVDPEFFSYYYSVSAWMGSIRSHEYGCWRYVCMGIIERVWACRENVASCWPNGCVPVIWYSSGSFINPVWLDDGTVHKDGYGRARRWPVVNLGRFSLQSEF